jgi:hypothetical protein
LLSRRQAFFFVRSDFNDERLQTGWSRHRAAFHEALALLPFPTRIAKIPFGAGSLTGYLMRPTGPIVPWPTVILPAGYDSTGESVYGRFLIPRRDLKHRAGTEQLSQVI